MYTQFTKESRIELGALLRAGHSRKECARELGMDKSALTRETNRNKDSDGSYRGASAHKKHIARRVQAKQGSRRIENDRDLQRHIKKRLMKRDSPEQIAGRIKRTKSHKQVSHETIYRWIFNEKPALKKLICTPSREHQQTLVCSVSANR